MSGLGALVAKAGGQERVLLVGECPLPGGKPPSARPWLEALARDLFGEEGAPPPPSPPPPRPWPPSCWPRCRLLLVLFRAASLSPARKEEEERFRLRAILLDLRRRLRGGFPAVVGVAVLTSPGDEGDPAGESARSSLLALLRGVFRERKGAAAEETLQAALYAPGGGGGATQVEQAACKALSAALGIQADGVEIETQKLPFFLQCLPWGRRRQQRKGTLEAAANKVNEDASQDAEEVVALTNMAPNGNCEDACGKAGI